MGHTSWAPAFLPGKTLTQAERKVFIQLYTEGMFSQQTLLGHGALYGKACPNLKVQPTLRIPQGMKDPFTILCQLLGSPKLRRAWTF